MKSWNQSLCHKAKSDHHSHYSKCPASTRPAEIASGERIRVTATSASALRPMEFWQSLESSTNGRLFLPSAVLCFQHLETLRRADEAKCPGTVLVFSRRQAPLGFVVVRRGSLRRMRGVFEITEGVLPDGHSGRLALADLRRWGAARGAWRLQTSLAPDERRLARLFTLSGFREEGRLRRAWLVGEQPQDAAWFGMPLQPPQSSKPPLQLLAPRARTSTPRFTIRQLCRSDATGYLDFTQRLLRETPFLCRMPKEAPQSADEAEAAIEAAARDDCRADLVAEAAGGKILGSISARAGSLPRLAGEVRFHMGVLKQFQGRGIGQLLLDAVETWARSTGKHRLAAGVMATNHAALAFYRKVGFSTEAEGQGVCRLRFQLVNEVIIGKLLTNAERR
jgi:RimJ/RimL family protein N-acetyltransferase